MPFCSRCGASLDASATVCPACGAPVETSSPTQPTIAPTPQMPRQRPTGVTIIAILAGLLGLFELISSLALMVLSTASPAFGAGLIGTAAFGLLGGFVLILSLLTLAGAYGFWVGTKWGWWLGIIVSVLWIIEIVSFNWISFLIGIVMIYYLTRPHIRAWFHELHGT